MQCSACGHLNPADAAFCMRCGAALVAACRQCAALLPVGAAFCLTCGAPVAAGSSHSPAPETAAPPTGETLRALLDRAPDHRLPLDQTLRIAALLCCELEELHQLGNVHGRLTADAVRVTPAGDVMLVGPGRRVSRRSVSGMAADTVGWLAPEQALGGMPDARSDLYSLGALLYEMVTGRPPFLGDDPVAIISQHVNTPPVAPSWHSPTLPKPLEALILRLLAKDPQQRPASAAEVRSALANIVPIDARPTTAELAQQEANPLDRLAGGVFVGREHELDAARATLDGALAGRGQVLLVVGEPGIGKTRLVEEVGTYASVRGALVLWGRCYAWEGAPAYWPWVQLIRSYAHESDPQALRSELGQGAADVANVVSEIRERLPGLPDLPAIDPEQARFRLFDSITTFLKNAARRQPLMLVLDDLHWADKPSLLLLEFVAREIGRARLLILGTYRDVEVGRQHPLSQTLAELNRSRLSRRILLRGFARDDVARFISLTSGRTPQDDLVDAVYRETEGNPFFVVEVVRLLTAEGRLAQQADGRAWNLSIPESVREVVGLRLNRLSEACNQVLTVASVVGREFRLTTLERVTGKAGDELLDLLEQAVQARLIEEQDSVGHYRFSHALVQETLYLELSTARRVRLHGQIGEAIERAQLANLTPFLGELAHHYFEAAPAGTIEKAIEYGVKAAQWAAGQVAWETAIEHYHRVLQAVELDQPPDDTRQCDLLLALASVQWRSGDAGAGRSTYLRAAETARALQ
ncbi:MAG: hypothetical protein DCC58_06385, partial [Chloroflexi bacterium]